MRIQHNIMAMGAYRNYTNNVNAMKKNLEKLSSGYKINRAGDDAAGLAISEKMRAQITGLETAQKNAKDGISLVQTAEGALTEVHDMLNRMVTLANQSANGTYDTIDREQLQKELNQLRTEIDRIAEASNFNGIKLLDGSMDAKYTTALGASSAVVDSLINGTSPSKAGAAEITLKLANNAATNSTPVEPTTQQDGTPLAKATEATATLTMGNVTTPAVTFDVTIGGDTTNSGTGLDSFNSNATFNDGDTVKVNLADGSALTYTKAAAVDATTKKFTTMAELKEQMAADGITLDNTTDATAATATEQIQPKITISTGNEITVGMDIADIKDLEYTAGKALDTLFDVKVTGANGTVKNSGTIAAGDTIELIAKKAGAQDAAVDTAMKAITATNGGTATYTEGVDEGLTATPSSVTTYDFEIDLSKLRGGMSIDIGGKKIEFKTDGTASSAAAAGGVVDLYGGQVDTDLKAALDAIFGTTDFETATSETNGDTFTYSIAGKGNNIKGDANNHVAATNLGEVRVFDAYGKETTGNDPAVTSTYTPVAEVTAPGGTPNAFATIAYELDASKLTAGSKITIGGKILEIADTADLANGKITKAGIDTELPQALEQMGYTSGKVTAATANGKVTISIEGTTVGEKATDLMKGAGSLSFLSAEDAPASKAEVTGGMSIEAGVTKISDLKAADMPDGKKLSDLFDITVNGNAQGNDYVIKEGDEIKFTAKNNGKYDDAVMQKFNFEGSVDSLSKQNGWDEGSGATGDKTHYELAIDLSKVAGGNSFTFGNVNGKSWTFDLSFDSEGTKNDTVNDKDNSDIAGNGERTTINLYGKTTAEAQAEIFNQVKAKMDAAGFDVTRSISGNKMTLALDAKEEGPEYNLGNIRTSSASGALTNAVYNPAGGSAGGTLGTMAQVTYNFDVSQLQAGDELSIGGTTIYIGDETKKEVVDGNVKLTISADEAKADPNKAIVEALESAGYRSGQVKFDTDNNKITITGIKTGETGEALRDGGAKITLKRTIGGEMDGGLTLQIGDTADPFNQLQVSIKNMHAASMGIGDIDISSQAGAAAAVDKIKAAINYVSDVRGTLGATQNRLDHTINNLSVMTENIQDAESTIRDTDVAEEMMAYTKNNILIQSAQAMLAQANQVPQGVLQLLQ